MAASTPEDCDRLIFEAVNSRDLEGIVALYEPNGTLIGAGDQRIVGQDAIREAMRPWMKMENARWTSKVTSFIDADGALALTMGSWAATERDDDGNTREVTGRNVEVVRRQADGTWRFVIDHPHGAG